MTLQSHSISSPLNLFLYKVNLSNEYATLQELISILGDVFEVGQYKIKAEHFLTPQPFHPNNTVIKKHVQFSVLHEDKLTSSYFLESSAFFGVQYVLSTTNYERHRQLVNYGTIPPKYIDMKDVVIDHLTVDENAIITSEKK